MDFRLESAWFGKFVTTCFFCKGAGSRILRKYHPELPESVIKKGHTQFGDFIHWIEDGNRNAHWRGPYHDLCHPCTIQYDYIVKLETQNDDANYIVGQKLKGRGLDLHRVSNRGRPTTAQGRHLEFFQNLTESQIDFLLQRNRDDFIMFDYGFDRDTYTAKCKNECC